MSVFISYSQDDQAAYSALCLALDGQQIARWDASSMVPGRPLSDQLQHAIQGCEACIFLATRRSIASRWCMAELGAFWGAGKNVVIYDADPDINEADFPPQFQGNLRTSDARQLVDAIRDIASPSDDAAPAEAAPAVPKAKHHETARDRILEYMTRKGFSRVRFSAIRKYVDRAYSDEFLLDVLRQFHSEFHLCTFKDGKQGLERI